MFGRETAELWTQLYPWYHMPVSIHQLCIHGHEAIKLSSLPASYLSEQSLESTNKSLKYYRTHHARKTSRIATITDVFNRQNDRSDLKIAMHLYKQQRRSAKRELPSEVRALLKVADANSNDDVDDDNANDDDDGDDEMCDDAEFLADYAEDDNNDNDESNQVDNDPK